MKKGKNGIEKNKGKRERKRLVCLEAMMAWFTRSSLSNAGASGTRCTPPWSGLNGGRVGFFKSVDLVRLASGLIVAEPILAEPLMCFGIALLVSFFSSFYFCFFCSFFPVGLFFCSFFSYQINIGSVRSLFCMLPICLYLVSEAYMTCWFYLVSPLWVSFEQVMR